MKNGLITSLGIVFCLAACTPKTDILVIGGGASGTAAAVQASRDGAKVVLAEETVWLGGMLTSAGVSAIDGNYNMRAGIFGEFCDSLSVRYGGYPALASGWVSNVLFQPRVGEDVLENIVAKEKNITLLKECCYVDAKPCSKGWIVTLSTPEGIRKYKTGILIDATELGDVAAALGVPYRVGMDARSETGEPAAAEVANNEVQDLTYVITIKDFGPDADMTIPRPEGYDSLRYVNCCANPYNTAVFEKAQELWSPEMMLSYGLLPSGEIMLNWPVEANDFYFNLIEMDKAQRDEALAVAKQISLGYLYFIQTALGYKNYGISDEEYPTPDGLPFIPYHRESRRIVGEVTFSSIDAASPYEGRPLYRTGIAVGDYPIDHHHFQNPKWRELPKHIFAPIPSFNVPAGVVMPKGFDRLIVCEKSISVTNIMNGTTRLQPVVIGLGQASGALAAICVKQGINPRDVKVRDLQRALLRSGDRIMPFLDEQVGEEGFEVSQRIGATGILRGTGMKVNWSNQMWLFTKNPLKWSEIFFEDYYSVPAGFDGFCHDDVEVSYADFTSLVKSLAENEGLKADMPKEIRKKYAKSEDSIITRGDAAAIIDAVLDPFNNFDVDIEGNVIR